MHDTAGLTTSDYEYGCDVYAKVLDCFCQIKRHVQKIFLCTRYVYEVHFLMMWNYNEDTQKHFCD